MTSNNDLVLTESEVDYILSILRHTVASKGGSRLVTEQDLA